MTRRALGVALGLVVVGVLVVSLDDQDGVPSVQSYPSVQALGQDIRAHGIGCSRVYPVRGPRPLWADHDAANCEVGSAAVTLHAWKDVSPPPTYLEKSRHESWVVGPNWLVASTNRLAAVQVALAIGGDLVLQAIAHT